MSATSVRVVTIYDLSGCSKRELMRDSAGELHLQDYCKSLSSVDWTTDAPHVSNSSGQAPTIVTVRNEERTREHLAGHSLRKLFISSKDRHGLSSARPAFGRLSRNT